MTKFQCNFCGDEISPEEDDIIIIVGIGAYICEDCVLHCKWIIKDRREKKAARKAIGVHEDDQTQT